MADPFLFDSVHQAAPAVKHAVKHVHHAAPHIKQGFSMIYTAIAILLSNVVTGGITWYISRRGIQGVQNDLNNAKNEIQNLANAFTNHTHSDTGSVA